MDPKPVLERTSVTTHPWAADCGSAAGRVEHALPPPLVEVCDLHVQFPNRARSLFNQRTRHITAVDGVTLEIQRREVLGLVGESGSGKTTVGRAILGLVPVSAGTVTFEGISVASCSGRQSKELRRRMQVVFQDPYSSLHPRFKVGRILREPLDIQGVTDASQRLTRVTELLELVGLDRSAADRFPHQFSGGQRQRIAIARALALDPDFIVADEPVSALDVSIQAQVLNLLKRLRRERGLAMLFISHDLAVIRHISDRVAVMYLGRLVEVASTDTLFARPSHPYTIALMSAVPRVNPKPTAQRIVLEGDLPSPTNPPSGCRFHTRCWLRTQLGNPQSCSDTDPALRLVGAGHLTACHFAEEVAKRWMTGQQPQTRGNYGTPEE